MASFLQCQLRLDGALQNVIRCTVVHAVAALSVKIWTFKLLYSKLIQ